MTLDRNDFFSRNSSYITSALYSGVTHLSMNKCNLGEDGGISVAEGVARSRQLKYLSLQHNFLMDETAKWLSDAVQRPTVQLEFLDLSCNKINDAGGELIGIALSKNRTIQRLNLRRNNLNEQTGYTILESVRFNRHIISLHLEKNAIGLNIIDEINEQL